MLLFHILKAHRSLENGVPILERSRKSAKLNQNKILLVGMADSSHFQRWLSIMQQEFPAREILLYPSDRPRLSKLKLSMLQQGTHQTKVFRILPQEKLNFLFYYVFDNLFGLRWRAYFLARIIIKHHPSVIHFHETQHGAYIYNLIVTSKSIPNNSRNIISTWGSDLTLYSWISQHYSNIRSALSWSDILTAEKEIEFVDAQRLGFNGQFRAPVYISLGRAPSEFKEIVKPSLRRIILVKGYQDNPGRALNALYVISQLKKELRDFEVIVYSASEAVQIQVEILRNRELINIRSLSRISHSEMQEFFEKARISISLAISDGLPGALLEAMQAGAFPIQSENSGVKEFLTHGESGFIVDPWDLLSLSQLLTRALHDNELVDSACEINRKALLNKYSLDAGIIKLRELYSD